jgi:hypothetical protein
MYSNRNSLKEGCGFFIMTKPIEFDAQCGNEIMRVKISQPTGAADILHIYIGKYYHGQAVFQQGQWRVYLAAKSEFNTPEDIRLLIEIVEDSANN